MVKNIQNIKWTKIANFNIHLSPLDGVFSEKSGFSKINIDLNAALISFSTPQYTNNTINKYVGFEFRYHQGRDELYRFTLTFRDFDSMTLFNTFRKAYYLTKDNYINHSFFDIKLIPSEDFGVKERPLFQTSTAIIENLSQLQFSHNTENQIAEFSVSFMCNTVEISQNHPSTSNSGQFKKQLTPTEVTNFSHVKN